MFEVIISNINTGRVWRRLFETRSEADGHFDHFLQGGGWRGRSRRDYRAEIYHRPLPTLHPLVCAAALVEEAA